MKWLLTALLFVSSAATGGELVGRVVGIADGDTLTILVRHQQVKIRLADIDAPESGQPYGSQSKQSLSSVCFGKPAVVNTAGTDRYGRTIGRVSCSGVDANAFQVRAGMSWVYEKYAPRESSLYEMQHEAMAAKRGLWAAEAVPPWEWRKTQSVTRGSHGH